MKTTTAIPYSCDKCGRSIGALQSYIEISGMKICGICQWEKQQAINKL